jgi:hypothetical protein
LTCPYSQSYSQSLSFQSISDGLSEKIMAGLIRPPTPVADNEIKALYVAGPRASKEPNVAEFVMGVLKEVFILRRATMSLILMRPNERVLALYSPTSSR